MRFSRIILASLAPLLGFTALMSPPAGGDSTREDVMVRLWHTVVQMVAAPAAETASVSSLPDHSNLPGFLPGELLSSVPSLRTAWMLVALLPLLILIRRPQRLMLRC